MSNIGFMSNVVGKWFFAIYQYIYYTQINENKIAKLPNSIQLSSLFHFSTKMFSSNQNIGESCPHNCFVQYSLMPKWSMTSYDQWMNEWRKHWGSHFGGPETREKCQITKQVYHIVYPMMIISQPTKCSMLQQWWKKNNHAFIYGSGHMLSRLMMSLALETSILSQHFRYLISSNGHPQYDNNKQRL